MCGLERGFERACERIGWRRPITAAYVEIEAFIAYNLVKQMEQGVLDAAPVHTNVKTFDGSMLRNRIDAIFGGYPCQPFSVVGLRKGAADPRHLWPFIGKGENSIIGTTKPIFCFFENVPGHITKGFDEVYRDLSDLGYAVEPGIFSAEEVGANHQRKRLFILAIKKETLGYAKRSGLEGHAWNGLAAERWQEKSRSIAEASVFPSGPGGVPKYFEAEKIIESGLCFTVNGYNFREDLLRMAGNGVVEQTAKLAFITLLEKQLKNIDNI